MKRKIIARGAALGTLLASQRGDVRRGDVKIQVLVTGCAKCKQLTACAVKQILAHSGGR